MSSLKPAIGILGHSLNFQQPVKIYNILKKKAEERGVQLHYLTNYEFMSTKEVYYKGNILHKFISHTLFDGLIILTNLIMANLTSEEFLNTLKIDTLPAVSLGIHLPGIPSVLVENGAGVYEAVKHLITKHGLKQIGFLKGPPNHPDAIERYEAYARAMKDHELQVNPSLILQGDFTDQSARQAIIDFLEKRALTPGKDIQAMLCANDYMAIRVQQELLRRGYHIPEDLAIIGFDNLIHTRSQNPQISSIENPVEKMAHQSFELILDLVEHKNVPDRVMVPAQFIPRESCGCYDKNEMNLSSNLSSTLDQMKKINPININKFINRLIKDSSGDTLDVWHKTLRILTVYNPFLEEDKDELNNKNISQFAKLAYLLINDIVDKSLQRLKFELSINQLGEQLSSTLDINIVINEFISYLPKIQVQHCCLCLYENNKDYNKPGAQAPISLLIMAFHHKNGQLIIEELPSKGIPFPTSKLIPDVIRKKYGEKSWIINALFYETQQIGYILFDHKASTRVLSRLENLLSSRFKSILLLKESWEKSEKLAKANKKINEMMNALKDENLHIKAEMEIAYELQTSLLPQNTKNIHPDFEIASLMEPAEKVGGDYYNIMLDKQENLWLGIGDVSGHGLKAGMTMMIAYIVQMTSTLSNSVSPRDVICSMNEIIFKTITQKMSQSQYMTCAILKYLGNGCFQFAGMHLDFLIYCQKEKKFKEIPQSGIWLNIREDIGDDIKNGEFQIDWDDILILYTDGFTEIQNKKGEMLYIEGLKNIIKNHISKDVESMIQSIKKDVKNWSLHTQDDDMSLVIIKRINRNPQD